MPSLDSPAYPFVSGLDLSERFYLDGVRPVLERAFPSLPYSAALIGYGSDVIGCDTAMSRDHFWGPRLILFLPEDDFATLRPAVDDALRAGLPREILGYPTSFLPPDHTGNRLPSPAKTGPVDHIINITTLPAYFDRELGPAWRQPSNADWLVFSEHRLLTLTAGRVFHDDLGLEAIRQRLDYYPRDVWLFQLASEWSKIGQEEPFVGRTGIVGDDLGSRLVAARLVQSCMRLAFLLQRRYIPYSKWFGTVFARLDLAPALQPHLSQALTAVDWKSRETALCRAYETLARRHNQLALTPPIVDRCTPFHDRPFDVIHGDLICETIQADIHDPLLRALRPYGSVNQFSSSTDLLEEVPALLKLKSLYL